MLAPETNRMYWDVLPANRRDRLRVNAARIVRAITQQYDRAQRQRGRFRQHPLQRVTDARGLRSARQDIRLLNPLRLCAELVKPHLEFIAERLQQPAVQDGLLAR